MCPAVFNVLCVLQVRSLDMCPALFNVLCVLQVRSLDMCPAVRLFLTCSTDGFVKVRHVWLDALTAICSEGV